jgi:hypothetical protein
VSIRQVKSWLVVSGVLSGGAVVFSLQAGQLNMKNEKRKMKRINFSRMGCTFTKYQINFLQSKDKKITQKRELHPCLI